MTNSQISAITARKILDSRGRPVVEAEITTKAGIVARASVPSGASTGKAEAVELRDGGTAWEGKDVQGAVRNIKDVIAPLLIGRDVLDQRPFRKDIRCFGGLLSWPARRRQCRCPWSIFFPVDSMRGGGWTSRTFS
jgi:enolase